MKTQTLSTNDVREICKSLIKNNGDCFEVATQTNYPIKAIRDIKEKKYMKHISDTYFNSNQWSYTPAVHEPDRITLTDDTPIETETESTQLTNDNNDGVWNKINTGKQLPTNVVKNICSQIVDGVTIKKICENCNVSENAVLNIKLKRRHKNISDKYFNYVDGHVVLLDGTVLRVKHARGAIKEETLRHICEDILSGEKSSKIAKKYGLARATITNIKSGHSYPDISKQYFVYKNKKVYPVGEVPEEEPTPEVMVKSTTLQISTTEQNIADEISDLTIQLLMTQSINNLPEDVQTKIIPILSEYAESLSLKQIREMINNG